MVDNFGFGDSILYAMCKENRKHENPDTIAGKMWLIGRSYAASPERRLGKIPDTLSEEQKKSLKSKTDSDFFGKLAKIMCEQERCKKIDSEITDMMSESYRFDESEEDINLLKRSVSLVQQFNEIIMESTEEYNRQKLCEAGLNGIERSPENNISFASKYLHFHLPDLIYIMDSYSLANSKKANTSTKSEMQNFKSQFISQYHEYANHVFCCYRIAQERKRDGKCYSPRGIDNYLMQRE